MCDPGPGWPPPLPDHSVRAGGRRRRRGPYRATAAHQRRDRICGAQLSSGGNEQWTCRISRRLARVSGCGPAGSSRGGKASVKPATQRARSSIEDETPPIAASAPYGSLGSSGPGLVTTHVAVPAAPRGPPRAGTSSRSCIWEARAKRATTNSQSVFEAAGGRHPPARGCRPGWGSRSACPGVKAGARPAAE